MTPPLPHQIRSINDTVMGGLSNSRVIMTEQGIGFCGEVSLANNGGFASMRGRWLLNGDDQSKKNIAAIQLTVVGDGKRYQFRLFTADNHDGSAYVYNFDTQDGEAITITAPVSAFSASFRGRVIQKPPLKLENILEYGLLIGDKQVGAFSLLLKSIELLEN